MMSSISPGGRWWRKSLCVCVCVCMNKRHSDSHFSVRRNAVRSRDPLQYSMEADITLQSLPPSVYRKVGHSMVHGHIFYF